MHDSFNIGLIGAGNLAWHLAPALENTGHRISVVYNRSRKNAHRLLERLYRADLKKNLNFSGDPVDLIILAVKDSVIEEVVSEIVMPENCQLIHTSGCQSIEVLEKSAATHTGVFYPLQTFSKGDDVDFRTTPVFIESSSESGLNQLIHLSKGLTRNFFQINSIQRRTLHLAAVISVNFSNHLFTIAMKLMREKHLDFDLLQPITHTMVQKIFNLGPEAGQTGPALRGDMDTMDLHMEMLENKVDLMEIYSMLSKHISETAKKGRRH